LILSHIIAVTVLPIRHACLTATDERAQGLNLGRGVVDTDGYLKLAGFHERWREYGLLPAELIDQLRSTFKPGMEEASEHDRNGVFHWWLKRNPSKDVLVKLVELSFLDDDQIMAADVRKHVAQCSSYDSEVESLIRERGAGLHDG
jgi:hypothetical protein